MMRAMYVMMPGPLRGMLAKREAGPSEEGLDATRPTAHGSKKSRDPYLGLGTPLQCALRVRGLRGVAFTSVSSSLGKRGPALFGTRKDRGCYTPARHASHP